MSAWGTCASVAFVLIVGTSAACSGSDRASGDATAVDPADGGTPNAEPIAVGGCPPAKLPTPACANGTTDTFTETVLQASPPIERATEWAQLIIDPAGFFHAIWGQRYKSIWYATNRGSSKVEPLVTVDSNHELVGARLAVDACGNAHVAYATVGGKTNYQLVLASRKGDVFDKRELVNETSYLRLRPAITLDDKGSPIVVVGKPGGGWTLHREVNQWKPEEHDDSGVVQSVAFSSTLGIVVGYLQDGAGNRIGILSSKDGGPWLASLVTTKEFRNVDTFMNLTVDASGRVHALYSMGTDFAAQLYYSSIAASNDWGPELRVSMPPAARGPEGNHYAQPYDLLLTSSGEAQVLFRDAFAALDVPYVSRLSGGVFQPPVALRSTTELLRTAGTIDGNGRAHILLAGMDVDAVPVRLLVQECAP